MEFNLCHREEWRGPPPLDHKIAERSLLLNKARRFLCTQSFFPWDPGEERSICIIGGYLFSCLRSPPLGRFFYHLDRSISFVVLREFFIQSQHFPPKTEYTFALSLRTLLLWNCPRPNLWESTPELPFMPLYPVL